VVEQKRYGVREDFAQQSACQMPQIARPHPLYAVALCELAEDGVYPVAKPTEEGTPFGIGIELLGGIWGQKLYAHRRQLFSGLGRMVVAVSEEEARSGLGEFGEHRELVGVGRGHREAADETGPADPYVHSETVEGLSEEGVLAEGGLPAESTAAVGASEEARWQGQRVADGEGGVVGSEAEKLLPERRSLSFQRLAAWRAKVVRWTEPNAGNHSP
jgi:hypothetical protein